MNSSTIGPDEDYNPFEQAEGSGGIARSLSSPEHRESVATELEALRRDGYVIIEGALAQGRLESLREEFDRLYAGSSPGSNSFAGFATRRLFNLPAKTRLLDGLILHPLVLALVESYLEDQIQLSICSSIDVGPGETAQRLHRDDGVFPLPRPHLPLLVNCMWAIDEFTADNGATRLLPASHRDGFDTSGEEGDCVIAKMNAGSVLLFDGALVHGGGANTSGRSRLGVTVNYSRAWLRQQENQFLAVPAEQVRTLPRELQKLMGYWVANTLLGSIDNESPMKLLR